jgi:hypothetical protein
VIDLVVAQGLLTNLRLSTEDREGEGFRLPVTSQATPVSSARPARRLWPSGGDLRGLVRCARLNPRPSAALSGTSRTPFRQVALFVVPAAVQPAPSSASLRSTLMATNACGPASVCGAWGTASPVDIAVCGQRRSPKRVVCGRRAFGVPVVPTLINLRLRLTVR